MPRHANPAHPAGTREKPSIRLVRRYDATPQKVWRAWTEPQALRAWFGPGEMNSVTRAVVDVRVGGRFRIAFRMPDGSEPDVSGTYLEVDPGRRLVFTWAWKDNPERESLVSIHFEPAGTGTQMTFLHEQFHDPATRDSHEWGWTACLDKLTHHLA